jgi:hypothetical protein
MKDQERDGKQLSLQILYLEENEIMPIYMLNLDQITDIEQLHLKMIPDNGMY